MLRSCYFLHFFSTYFPVPALHRRTEHRNAGRRAGVPLVPARHVGGPEGEPIRPTRRPPEEAEADSDPVDRRTRDEALRRTCPASPARGSAACAAVEPAH